MSFINKKNSVIAGITFAIGIFAVASFFGFSLIHRGSTVTGKITNVLLDREGRANGVTLDSGLQINFSVETGEAIFAAAKIGDEVSATGNSGTKTNYGQAFHAEQLTVNGQSFTEIGAPKPPKGEGPRPPKTPKGEGRHRPRPDEDGPNGAMRPNPDDVKLAPENAPDDIKPAPENAPLPPKPAGEALNASGTIGQFLVTMRGDIDGVILSSGEQIRFSPRVGEKIASAGTEANSQISVEGIGMKNERGTVLQANKMTIGNQTFTINE